MWTARLGLPMVYHLRLAEATEFDQKFQLQPIVYEKLGTVDWFLTFKDFLNRLDRLGVDITNFDKWGSSLQFNWVPPIDIDKLINYQDYYWDSASFDDIPQYITIKNQYTWAVSRFSQMQKSVVSCAPTVAISTINTGSNKISITGNQVGNFTLGEMLVSLDSMGQYALYTIAGIVFNTASLKTDITVNEPVTDLLRTITKTALPIVSADIAANKITIKGDLHYFSQKDMYLPRRAARPR
jgi:hypothetical protein